MRHSINTLKFITVRVILGVLACNSCFAQDSQSVSTAATGTLNLLLANRRGFVIAADSRMTQLSQPMQHWDDSQKVFKVGPKAAMAIAGFASWARGSPFEYQVAAALREEFSDREWTSGERQVTSIAGLINTTVGFQLGLLGALLATKRPAPPAASLDFHGLAAGINKSGKTEIVRIAFKPRVQPLGPFGLGTPFYDISSTTTVVAHFVAFSAGLDRVARAILDGTIETPDRRILTYYRSRTAGQLDELSLDDLEGLAIAILAQTKSTTQFVGGPDQIGVFAKGSAKWTMPQLPTDRQKLTCTILRVGSSYGALTPEEYSRERGKEFITIMNLSLIQPFEEPLRQVFVGGQFRDVSVSLDGNVFAGNRFSNVTFKYQGGSFYFLNNTIDKCVVETAPDVTFLRSLGPVSRSKSHL
jgi:hypothetical protein